MLEIENVTIEVLNFWFIETSGKQRFAKDLEFDAQIRRRFLTAYEDIQKNGHERYRTSADTILAAIVILDQFSRNMFRDKPQAFSEDHRATALAIYAVENGLDQDIPEDRRSFLYMPFMHSEKQEDHDRAVDLFAALSNTQFLEYELKHKAIIDRFGRYPHRNAVLGRRSTVEENAFNAEHGGF